MDRRWWKSTVVYQIYPRSFADSEHAGFTSGKPWIPVNPSHRWVNAAAQLADERSVFAHYRRLVELRHREPRWRTATSRHCCPAMSTSAR